MKHDDDSYEREFKYVVVAIGVLIVLGFLLCNWLGSC